MSKEDNDRLKVKFKTKIYLEKIDGCALKIITEAWYTPEKGIYKIEKVKLGKNIEEYYEKFGEETFLEDFKDLLSIKITPILNEGFVVDLLNYCLDENRPDKFTYNNTLYEVYQDRIEVQKVENARKKIKKANPFAIGILTDILMESWYNITGGGTLDRDICRETLLEAFRLQYESGLLTSITLLELKEKALFCYNMTNTLHAIDSGLERLRWVKFNE